MTMRSHCVGLYSFHLRHTSTCDFVRVASALRALPTDHLRSSGTLLPSHGRYHNWHCRHRRRRCRSRLPADKGADLAWEAPSYRWQRSSCCASVISHVSTVMSEVKHYFYHAIRGPWLMVRLYWCLSEPTSAFDSPLAPGAHGRLLINQERRGPGAICHCQ